MIKFFFSVSIEAITMNQILQLGVEIRPLKCIRKNPNEDYREADIVSPALLWSIKCRNLWMISSLKSGLWTRSAIDQMLCRYGNSNIYNIEISWLDLRVFQSSGTVGYYIEVLPWWLIFVTRKIENKNYFLCSVVKWASKISYHEWQQSIGVIWNKHWTVGAWTKDADGP